MSVHRNDVLSRSMGFGDEKKRDTHHSWFDGHARYTPGSLERLDQPSTLPEMVVVKRDGELSPATAGAIAGALAGPAMLGVATLLTTLRGATSIAHTIGSAVSRGALVDSRARMFGWAVVVVVGALFGALFAHTARRLRQFAPMITFGILTATAAWTVFHSLVLPRAVPWLAKALPFGPMAIGAMVFGAVVALEVPIRTRAL